MEDTLHSKYSVYVAAFSSLVLIIFLTCVFVINGTSCLRLFCYNILISILHNNNTDAELLVHIRICAVVR